MNRGVFVVSPWKGDCVTTGVSHNDLLYNAGLWYSILAENSRCPEEHKASPCTCSGVRKGSVRIVSMKQMLVQDVCLLWLLSNYKRNQCPSIAIKQMPNLGFQNYQSLPQVVTITNFLSPNSGGGGDWGGGKSGATTRCGYTGNNKQKPKEDCVSLEFYKPIRYSFRARGRNESSENEQDLGPNKKGQCVALEINH